MNNRASQGQYPPGSVFKVMMAAAALETKTVTPSTSIFCNGGYQFGRRVYHDWKAGGHGSVDLRHALVHSCDVYFYTVGQRMGIETMASFAHQFGLGEETGIELPSERVGSYHPRPGNGRPRTKRGCQAKRSRHQSVKAM